MTKDNRFRILLGTAALLVPLDQCSKWIVAGLIPAHETVPVIHGFFNLVNIRNRGAAFGFLNSPHIEWQFWLFLGAACVAAWAIWRLARDAHYDRLLFVALGAILGGAAGNLIDRLRLRAVIDFLDFHLAGWHWPAFNIADCAICIGAGLVCFALWRAPADSEGKT
ncbi:MAG: signal peptidase II [Deltaproteobacteria bacterium]|nr:signal peptidase II [Deltaproteobacteria bacterium]